MTEPVVAVRGELTREAPPEIATVSVSVAARDKDRQTTLARLVDRQAALGALLDSYAAAIEKRETSGVYVFPETKGAGERVVGYRGSVTTELTVVDFTVLGELLLRLADADLMTVAGPYWALRPDSPVYRQARRDAIAEAITRAKEYAEALGAQVVRLIELADAGLSRPDGGPVELGMAQAYGGTMRAMASGPALDLEPRQQRVYAAVDARFAITAPTL